ncbi:PEP/pyruvate-binding domain-containing protein [Micromonospora endolithica]|uniref:PEP/pyruvate-binding domain-containing protein n=1 Tax=Micromonospora endolithica TaxID=230091 RepID=UPI001FD25736|nr:PEP/pyruvate-binding domain-containing protein [Micromonospora endolithica]
MRVMALSEVTAGMLDLVGGKAAGLGELIRHGERVPEGFCVTTEAHRLGVVPQAEVVAAYQRLGGARWRCAPAPPPRTCRRPVSPGSRTPS